MPISLIAAISENNCIGKDGDLPWHLPEDMKHFKEKTKGKIVLMGRKTWESIPEKFRPLPHRKNIVITRNPEYAVPKDVDLFQNINDAISKYPNQEIVVIGGGQIYNQTMDIADTLYITHVHEQVNGDAFFPEIDLNTWHETERDERDNLAFVTYKK